MLRDRFDRCRLAERLERFRRKRVQRLALERREPLVDDLPEERVGEAREWGSRRVGGCEDSPDARDRERIPDGARRETADPRGEPGIELAAEHRRRGEPTSDRTGQLGDARREHALEARVETRRPVDAPGGIARGQAAQDLLHPERVPRGELGQPLGILVRERAAREARRERRDLLERKRRDGDALHLRPPHELSERGRDRRPRRRLGSQRRDHEDGMGGHVGQQRVEQRDRRLVAFVQVVEEDRERAAGRCARERAPGRVE